MLNVKEQKAHILTADKKLVDWLLSMNTNNRHLRKTHVAWLENAIAAKEFILTGHGITISKEGKLLDGQHRLLAIVNQSYPPVPLLVVTGLEEKSQMYIDQHAKRSLSDMLRLSLDKSVTNQMTAVLTFLLKVNQRDGTFSLKGKTKPSLQEVYDKMAETMDDITVVLDATGKHVRAAVTAAIYHYYLQDPDAAIELAMQIRDGELLKKTDPAYQLRRYIDNHPSGSSTQALESYRYTVTACLAHSQGRAVEVIRPSNSWAELGYTQRGEINRKKRNKRSRDKKRKAKKVA